MKPGHQLSQRGGTCPQGHAGGTAPSRRGGCAIKPYIGASWGTGIIYSPEHSLSPPALLGTFKMGRDKVQATKQATGSNPALAQVLHFHTRREEPCPPCKASLGDGDQSPTSCPRSKEPSSFRRLHPSGPSCIHRSRLALLITAVMVPTGLLFLFGDDRGRQCEAFIFGTLGYLCRLCGLKGRACSLYDNRLLLLLSSKAKAKTYYTANFVLGQQLPPNPLC